MPSAPRDAAPGIHHVWINATGNWSYFLDDVDRLTWLRHLVRVCDRFGWKALAFCQMTTHVHALLEIADRSLSVGMESLNKEYGKAFNARHERSGYLRRKRFGSRRVVDGRDLLGAYAYVVNNPVREGMCERAEDWRWSSYASTLGLTRDFDFVDASIVLAELDGSVEALRTLVESRAKDGSRGHVR